MPTKLCVDTMFGSAGGTLFAGGLPASGGLALSVSTNKGLNWTAIGLGIPPEQFQSTTGGM